MSAERSIVALPTYYGGVKFKSALEARWAMYFDEISVEWRYEDEGYELPSGRYLPDFWLPVAGMHAEVKPDTGFSLTELKKCLDLVGATRNKVLLLDGPPRAVPFYCLENSHSDAIELLQPPKRADHSKGADYRLADDEDDYRLADDEDTYRIARIGDTHGGYFTIINQFGEEEWGSVITIAVDMSKLRLQRGEGVWIEEWCVPLPYGNQWLRLRAKESEWGHLLSAYEYSVARNARRTRDGRLVKS